MPAIAKIDVEDGKARVILDDGSELTGLSTVKVETFTDWVLSAVNYTLTGALTEMRVGRDAESKDQS